jgi:hypothetical protein
MALVDRVSGPQPAHVLVYEQHPACIRAIAAAFIPDTPHEHDDLGAYTPDTPPISTPLPPPSRQAMAPTCGAIRPATSDIERATAAIRPAPERSQRDRG